MTGRPEDGETARVQSVPMTAEVVLAAVTDEPGKVADIGLRLLDARGLRPAGDLPVGQALAAHGISLSGVQQQLDALVRDGLVRELRGRDLWDGHWPGLGPDAKGRHFVRR